MSLKPQKDYYSDSSQLLNMQCYCRHVKVISTVKTIAAQYCMATLMQYFHFIVIQYYMVHSQFHVFPLRIIFHCDIASFTTFVLIKFQVLQGKLCRTVLLLFQFYDVDYFNVLFSYMAASSNNTQSVNFTIFLAKNILLLLDCCLQTVSTTVSLGLIAKNFTNYYFQHFPESYPLVLSCSHIIPIIPILFFILCCFRY